MTLTGEGLRARGDALPADRESIGFKVDDGWKLLAKAKARHEDGHDAKVYVHRMPARFYLVECKDLDLGLDTGSGMADLAADIANAIAEGMLGVHKLRGAVE